MRYDDFRRSDDIDDRRDDGGGMGGGGGGFGMPMGGGGLGIGTIIILGLVGYAFGIDPRILIGGAEILTGGNQAPTYQTDRRSGPAKTGAPKDEVGSMISGILGEIDDRWTEIFQSSGQNYTGPRIVLRDKKVSTSYVQRRLQVGYNKAASLIERMEKDGLVGQPDHVGRREVLIDPDGHPI